MGFSEEFINGIFAGQQARDTNISRQMQAWRFANEKADRDIEVKLLQHRLKEIKLNDSLAARQAAQQQIAALNDLAPNQITPDMTEGGVLPSTDLVTGETTPLKPISVPGLDFGDYQLPGYSIRPRTLQDTLSRMNAEARLKALTEPYTLSEGAVRKIGTTTLATNPKVEKPKYVWAYDRDAKGKTVRRYVTEEEAASHNWEVEPMPHTTVVNGSPEDINAYVGGIADGTLSSILDGLKGGDRVKISAGLVKKGINLKNLQADEQANRKFFATLNSDDQTKVLQSAQVLEDSLNDLETAQAAWKSSGNGAFSKLALQAALNGTMGSKAKAAATDFQNALNRVQEATAALKAGGSAATNLQIQQAQAAINAGTNVDKAITDLRRAGDIRVRAIRGAQAVLPSQSSSYQGAGDSDFVWDPSTNTLIPSKK